MSKGLEALKRIKPYADSTIDADLEIIEKELKDLEERREMMRRFNEACVPMVLDNEIEKKLKALEIISQLFDFKYFIEEWYKRGVLPKEEYGLLKEVLL